jgi:polyisoprenyl-phosphate glycosyltransferase
MDPGIGTPPKFVILAPLLDDWVSLSRLVEDISRTIEPARGSIEIVVIDDGSTMAEEEVFRPVLPSGGCIAKIEIVRLALNLGHQRAIAVGLSCVAPRNDLAGVIVMDSDGEDRPADIPKLMDEAAAHPDHVVFARRAERSEGPVFKVGYSLYKGIFRAMTGREISFGNYSLIPMPAVRRLVHMPELWNNLPATIIRSRLAYRAVDTARGVRYAGVSSMNLPSLILHGLSAMAVYTDIMFVRVLLAASALCAIALTAIAPVVVIRLTTQIAVPGWATTAFGNLLIIILLALLIIVATTFMVLANRSSRPFVPIADTGVFIAERNMVAERHCSGSAG